MRTPVEIHQKRSGLDFSLLYSFYVESKCTISFKSQWYKTPQIQQQKLQNMGSSGTFFRMDVSRTWYHGTKTFLPVCLTYFKQGEAMSMA